MLQVNTIGSVVSGSVCETRGHTVIISDRYGNPIVVTQEIADGTTVVAISGDDDFQAMLKNLGIDKLVLTQKLASPEAIRGSSPIDPHRVGDFINDTTRAQSPPKAIRPAR